MSSSTKLDIQFEKILCAYLVSLGDCLGDEVLQKTEGLEVFVFPESHGGLFKRRRCRLNAQW